MDPVSLIVSALTAGAVAALEETAGTAIKDAYQGLVSLLRKKNNKNSEAKAILDDYAKDPNTWQKPLEKSIQESGAAEDKDVLLAAQKILELLQSQRAQPKYNVKIEGDVQGFVQGDNAKVTMNFSKPEKKRKSNLGGEDNASKKTT